MSGIVIPSEWGKYINTHGVHYAAPENWSHAFAVVAVLQQLNGKPWDDLALALVSGLRPYMIRVTQGETKCDACVGRVTVYVTPDYRIQGIWMEMGVDTPDLNGAELCEQLGLDDE